MTDRIDGYLSKIAQCRDREALVLRLASGEWVIRHPAREDVSLGGEFRAALPAVRAWVHAQKKEKI